MDEGSPLGFVGPVNQVFLVHHPDTRVVVVDLNSISIERFSEVLIKLTNIEVRN